MVSGTDRRRPSDEAVVEGVPVDVFLSSQDQQGDLLRELKLVQLGESFGLTDGHVAARISRLVGAILERYDDVRATTRAQALAARARGRTEVDLRVPLLPGISDALQEWLALLEDADALCARGDLLTLPSSPEVRQLRRRYVADILRQLPPA